MRHRWFIVLPLVAAVGCSAPPLQAPTTAPRLPNIVFILVDDMRWDEMGVAGIRSSRRRTWIGSRVKACGS